MHRTRFAFTLSLALLATGCYTQLRAPRGVHDDAAPPPAQDDDATTPREETDLPRVHTPVFVLPHYSYSDYWVHCGPYGWGIERYRRHDPWVYRCGLTDRYGWFSDYDWHRQVYGDYVPALWHDVWPVRAYRPRSGRGPRFAPDHPEVGGLDADAVVRSRFRRRGFAGGDTIHGPTTGKTAASQVRDRERRDAAEGGVRNAGQSTSRPERPIQTAGRAWRPDSESVPLKGAPGAATGGSRIAERGDGNEAQTRRPAKRYREDRRGRSRRDGSGSGRAPRPAKPESKQVQEQPSPSGSSGSQPSSQEQVTRRSEEKEERKQARREKRKESRRRRGK